MRSLFLSLGDRAASRLYCVGTFRSNFRRITHTKRRMGEAISSSAFIRWGGLSAMVGGFAWATGWGAQWYLELDGIKGVSYFLLLLGAMVAIPALHTLLGECYSLERWFALMGCVGLALMLVYEVVGVVTERYLPGIVWIFIVGSFAATMGIVFLGAICLATRVLPWWCGAALVVGAPSFTAFLGPGVGVAWMVVGYAIFRAGEHQSERNPQVL
jgi:hypothetical protein